MSGPTCVAVIGSNSFSGAHCVKALLERGIRVVGCSRSPEPDPAYLPYRWRDAAAPSFRFVQCDLNHDLDGLMAILDAERPELVINFAAQSMVAESWQNPLHWYQTNVVATIALHERLRHCDYLARYVHVTTPEVYGSTTGVVREDAPFRPSTPYAVSRAAADMSLATYHAAYGFPVIFTRAANVYGPGQQLYRIIPRAMLSFRMGKRLPLHGGGHSERSFIHIDDVIAATLRAAGDGQPGATYHISGNRWITIRGLTELICQQMGVDFASHVDIVGERLGKDMAYHLDSAKIRGELGWSDTISLEQGLAETLAWIDRHFETLKNHPVDYRHKP
ncbi:MAG TPA: GDP-mannose 4,6-dehydratase [Azonexus sp.]|nr:GDP-mannose 4,6-dehydratase [Azonexus sp.]